MKTDWRNVGSGEEDEMKATKAREKRRGSVWRLWVVERQSQRIAFSGPQNENETN